MHHPRVVLALLLAVPALAFHAPLRRRGRGAPRASGAEEAKEAEDREYAEALEAQAALSDRLFAEARAAKAAGKGAGFDIGAVGAKLKEKSSRIAARRTAIYEDAEARRGAGTYAGDGLLLDSRLEDGGAGGVEHAIARVARAAETCVSESTGVGEESSGDGRYAWGTWVDSDKMAAVIAAVDDVSLASSDALWASTLGTSPGRRGGTSTRVFSDHMFQKTHLHFENLGRDDHSSKDEPK